MAAVEVHRWSHTALAEPCTHRLADGRIVVGYAGRPEGGGRCEDAALVILLPAGGLVLAVADGMGGGPRADDASATIVDLLAARAKALSGAGNSRVQVLDAIEEASAEIRSWGVGAATTVVVAEIEERRYRTYHVGDSEALVTGQRGRVKWRTISHSPVGYATASGILEAGDAMVHEDRHYVDSMLGLEGMRVDVGERRPFAALDTLVLGSDGLFDNVEEEELVQIIRSGPLTRSAEQLCQSARQAMQGDAAVGKPDDLAFILYRPTSGAGDRS